MNRTIQAIYENGLLRPLVSLDLPEKTVVEIDLHLPEGGNRDLQRRVKQAFCQAGLDTQTNLGFPKSKIPDERRRALADIFAAEKPLGDYIDEDRESRG